MLRAALKSLLSRKGRLFLSGIAVIMGVAFISGTLVLNSSLGDSIRSMFSTAFENVDAEVSADSESNGEADPVPASMLEEVSATDGVDEAVGMVSAPAGAVQVLDKEGKVLPSTGAPTIGENWTGEEAPLQLRDGKGPDGADEVAINAGLADTLGYEVGDTMEMVVGEPEPREFTISGVFGYEGDRDTLGGESTVAFTTSAAQDLLLDGKDAYTSIQVRGDGEMSQTELKDELSDVVGSGYKVKTGEKLAEEAAGSLGVVLDFFNYLLLGFGSIALLVSIFLIINTFSIIVAQRTRELALFRAIGAGRGQVTGSVMLEAFIIGAFSAIVGLGLGIGLGAIGTTVAAQLFGSMETTLTVPPEAIIAALVIGIGVTMFAALLPAMRAGRIPPIAALRDAANTERPVRVFAIIGGLLLAGGGGLLAASLTEQFGALKDNSTLWGVFGSVLLLFLGATIFTPAITRPLVALIGLLFSWSLPGKLGRRNSSRNPRRTAITATALMIGICLVTAVGVLFSSADASVKKYLDDQLQADLLVAPATAGGQELPTFDPEVLDKTADMDDVDRVAGIYLETQAKADGETAYVDATNDMGALSELLALKADKGEVNRLGENEVIVDAVEAKESKLDIGDTVELSFGKSQQPQEFTVSGIAEPADMYSSAYMVDDVHAKDFATEGPSQAFIQVEGGTDPKTVNDDVSDLLADNPLMTVADVSVMTDQMTQMFDIMLMVVQVLLGLAMLIAVIGVVNTLTLSVRERTRELGLLRATGLTRGQVTRMVTVESIVISLFGAVLGLAVGAGLGIAVQQALREDFVDVLAMPWTTMGFYLIAAVVIGFFAALIPAYRANRLDVLAAISHE